MNADLTFDDTRVRASFDQKIYAEASARCLSALDGLQSRSGAGNEFLGWLDLPEQTGESLDQVLEQAEAIRNNTDVLIVIGIGGSYLGARAVIDALPTTHAEGGTEVRYAGNHISGRALLSLLDSCADRRVSVNVISKSGTTTEPALAFRVVKGWMEQRYGKPETARRITATTDASRGALRTLAGSEGYKTFVIPDSVGGRFSVLTPVGLLPIAVAGIDVRALLQGAARMMRRALLPSLDENPSLRYAAARRAFAANGKAVEVLAGFDPAFAMIAEWWKQLFGESEGKKGLGLFPASVINTTDLHSMGQYLQDGARNLFETFLLADDDGAELLVPSCEGDPDGLEYLTGRSFGWINSMAWEGTALAHESGGAPNMSICLPRITAATIGSLLYFFQVAVAISGYAMGINPFDQPGVEAYKGNMFALLGKPGFEEERAALLARMNR